MGTKTVASANEVLQTRLPGVVIFPGMAFPMKVTGEKALRAIDQAWQSGQRLLLTSNNDDSDDAEIGCLVEILNFQFDGDRNADVIFQGVGRHRVARTAEDYCITEELQDVYRSSSQSNRQAKRRELLAIFYQKLPTLAENQLVLSALECDLPFGTLCDLIAASLQINDLRYGALLAELDVDQRSEILLEILLEREAENQSGEFPPLFSCN